MTKTLLWFRQDLRLMDNPILAQAITESKSVTCLYIHDEQTPGDWALGGAQKWWLHHSLKAFQASLKDHGHTLLIKAGNAAEVINDLVEQQGFDTVFWNRCYEPYAIKRDTVLKQKLSDQGVDVRSFSGSLLNEPHVIKTGGAEPYKVFTPYWKRIKAEFQPRQPLGYDCSLLQKNTEVISGLEVEDLPLLPERDWADGFSKHWSPGEKGAHEKLEAFLDGAIYSYDEDRNRPSIEGTSRLSPHLHFGEISPHQIWERVHLEASKENMEDAKGVDVFLSEIAWREFSYNLLFHYPHLPDSAFREKFNEFPWEKNPKALEAWQKGQTGIPIVDAGMRQLWQEGWMHNRVRMIVGSLLTKNLLLHWYEGERWFWDCLVDADLASNAAGWQWIAGSGADAQPFFRIFNPVSQGEKFDEDGDYVRKFVPELKKLSAKYIHAPWTAPPEELLAAGIELGRDYPSPIVDLKESRKRALAAYAEIK